MIGQGGSSFIQMELDDWLNVGERRALGSLAAHGKVNRQLGRLSEVGGATRGEIK